MTKLAASLSAFVMFATSSPVGGAARLCFMNGQVRSKCCCEKPATETHKSCAKIARTNDCCEVCVSNAIHLVARVETARQDAQTLPIVAMLPAMVQAAGPATAQANPQPEDRGPPPGRGPPVFVWNCSYLI